MEAPVGKQASENSLQSLLRLEVPFEWWTSSPETVCEAIVTIGFFGVFFFANLQGKWSRVEQNKILNDNEKKHKIWMEPLQPWGVFFVSLSGIRPQNECCWAHLDPVVSKAQGLSLWCLWLVTCCSVLLVVAAALAPNFEQWNARKFADAAVKQHRDCYTRLCRPRKGAELPKLT